MEIRFNVKNVMYNNVYSEKKSCPEIICNMIQQIETIAIYSKLQKNANPFLRMEGSSVVQHELGR